MDEPDPGTDPYTVRETVPAPDVFVGLRDAAGMAPRSSEGVERGLPNSVYGVTVVHDPTGERVGMGRIVGDGGTIFHICDMAVHPAHQRQGLGTRIMEALLSFIEESAPPRAYVNLMADVDEFYEQFGFERTRPDSTGMYFRVR